MSLDEAAVNNNNHLSCKLKSTGRSSNLKIKIETLSCKKIIPNFHEPLLYGKYLLRFPKKYEEALSHPEQ